jgi:hypothetical protein
MTGSVTKPQMEDILQFSDIFSKNLYSRDTSISLFDQYVYSQEIFDLVMAFTRSGFIIDFNWEFFEGEAQFFFEKPAQIKKMKVDTLRKLVTFIVKKDEKQNGFIARACDRGILKAIMERLAILYNSMT